jgi:exodeoxyribonuclease VII large subunit
MARLDALSPLSVLTRGYSISEKEDGKIVRNVHQISVGDRLRIRVAEGTFGAEVKEIE